MAGFDDGSQDSGLPVRWTVVPFTETENVGEVREQGRSWTRWGWVPLRPRWRR